MSKEFYIQAGKQAKKWHETYCQEMKNCRFDTIAVHGIYSMKEALDFNQGSIIEPIYMASAQAFRDADEMEAALTYQIPTWCYSRIGNPSIHYLEGVLALLETYGTTHQASCCVTSSGMSAIHSACEPFLVCDPSAPQAPINFVGTCQVYGGTFQQFAIRKDKERNLEWRKVIDANDIQHWESLIDKNTRFLYGELPSNPSLSFFDIKKIADLAHSYNLPLIIDATVATPALLRPLAHGADIVIHSVTKSLTSSGMGIAGAIIAKKDIVSTINNTEMKKDFATYLKVLPNRDNGPNLSPMNAMMALNDIRTLRSKIDLMSRNTQKVAAFLVQHPHVEQVDYLGLKSHPLHKLASKYLVLVDSEHDDLYSKKINRYGHLMSFRVKGGAKAARDVFDNLKRIWRATDLGRIKSVATIPAISTHQQQGEEGRKLADIPPNLIRLSVGAEHPDDVIKDLKQALSVLDGISKQADAPNYSAAGASSAVLSIKTKK